MSLTKQIFEKLNESAEVKKTYGDKPQEGKTEKLERGKKTSIPNGKADNKVKANKLQNVNNQAADAYANDTDKVMDKVDSKEQSDKGKVAKATVTKSDKKVKFPFGDKPQKSDSKLIKEGASCEDCKECDKKLKEDYDNGSWMKHQTAIENELEAAKEEMEEDAFLDFIDGVINLCQNYGGQLNQLESAKIKNCNGKECK